MAAGLFALSGWLRRRLTRRRRSRLAGPGRPRPDRRPRASRAQRAGGALIAFATFVVVAVGAFRRVETGSPDDAASGTGGYTLMAEVLSRR